MAKMKLGVDQPGKVKIRVIEFEVEGSDTTMQESLRSITAALSRGTPSRVKYVQQLPAPGDEQADHQELEEEAAEPETADVASEPSRKSTGPRKPRSMKLLTNVNFNDVAPTLKEFAGAKDPKSDFQRYLVIAYWFKHHKAMPDLTPDHFFTAYRHMQWPVPNDPAQPIRDLRHKKRTQLSAGGTAGTSVINHVGEEVVLAMGKTP